MAFRQEVATAKDFADGTSAFCQARTPAMVGVCAPTLRDLVPTTVRVFDSVSSSASARSIICGTLLPPCATRRSRSRRVDGRETHRAAPLSACGGRRHRTGSGATRETPLVNR